jgi:hypothetical protein
MTHECGIDCMVGFDLEKMEEAIKGPFYAMPDDVTSIEEMRAWFKEFANNTDEENEKYLSKD